MKLIDLTGADNSCIYLTIPSDFYTSKKIKLTYETKCNGYNITESNNTACFYGTYTITLIYY